MFRDTILDNVAIALIIIAGSAVAGRLLRWLIAGLFRKITHDDSTALKFRLLRVFESRIVALSIVAGCSLGIREIRAGLTADRILHHQILDYCNIATFIALAAILANIISRVFKETMEWYSRRVSAANRSEIAPSLVPFATKLVNILILLIVVMIVLDHLGVNIGGLLVSLGVGSLALALAAQETLANMIAWFVIIVDQPVRIGDRIRLPSGEEGDVYQIGLRSTRILNYDNNLIVVPNGELVKNRIINLSVPDPSTSIIVEVTVAYGADVDRVRGLILGLASGHPELQADPPPKVFVTSLGETGLQMKLIARTMQVTRKFLIETSLREEMYKQLTSAGIRIAAVQRIISSQQDDGIQIPRKA